MSINLHMQMQTHTITQSHHTCISFQISQLAARPSGWPMAIATSRQQHLDTFRIFRTKMSQAVQLLSDSFMLSHIFSPTMMLLHWVVWAAPLRVSSCQGTPMASHTEEKQASVSNQMRQVMEAKVSTFTFSPICSLKGLRQCERSWRSHRFCVPCLEHCRFRHALRLLLHEAAMSQALVAKCVFFAVLQYLHRCRLQDLGGGRGEDPGKTSQCYCFLLL